MSLLRLLPAVGLAVVSGAWASDFTVAPLPPELRGILVTGGDCRFAVVSAGGGFSGWVRRGETIQGWKVVDYLPREESIVLNRDGRRVTVHLNTSAVADGDPAGSTAKATVADADDVLNKMKFDAMWDRIVVEQKKGIIGGMRQQATAEFTKLGLAPTEIDGLLDRMGDAIVSGMQSDEMRQDFARIYAEVYTKDELRGMAAFYDTAAGRAWAEKQPEVQQKLMQVMMPRVMQGMPAAQKIAADYIRQRATPPPATSAQAKN